MLRGRLPAGYGLFDPGRLVLRGDVAQEIDARCWVNAYAIVGAEPSSACRPASLGWPRDRRRARSELWLHDSDLPPPITTSSGGGSPPADVAVERASPHAASDELALVTAPKKPKPADTTRADFVRARPEMSVANLLVAAKAAGIGLSSSHAFEIRAVDRRAGKTASATVSAPTTTTSASAVPTAMASKNRATKKSRRKRRAKSAIARIAVASTPVASVKLAAPEAELPRLVLELGLVHVDTAIAGSRAIFAAWVNVNGYRRALKVLTGILRANHAKSAKWSGGMPRRTNPNERITPNRREVAPGAPFSSRPHIQTLQPRNALCLGSRRSWRPLD